MGRFNANDSRFGSPPEGHASSQYRYRKKNVTCHLYRRPISTYQRTPFSQRLEMKVVSIQRKMEAFFNMNTIHLLYQNLFNNFQKNKYFEKEKKENNQLKLFLF